MTAPETTPNAEPSAPGTPPSTPPYTTAFSTEAPDGSLQLSGDTSRFTVWTDDDARAFEAAVMHPALTDGPLAEMVEGFITGTVISPFDGLADVLMGSLLAVFDLDLDTLDAEVREPLLAIVQKRMDAILDGLDQDIAQEVAAHDAATPPPEYSVYAPLLTDWQEAALALNDDTSQTNAEPALTETTDEPADLPITSPTTLPLTAELWARGMQLARLMWQEDHWKRLDKSTRKDVAKLYAPIDRLCLSGKQAVTGERQRLKLFDESTDVVYALHDITQRFYDRLAVAHAPIIKAVTPGRNDPCSCGSGKKYKKCCGAG